MWIHCTCLIQQNKDPAPAENRPFLQMRLRFVARFIHKWRDVLKRYLSLIVHVYCMNIEQDENNTTNVSEARRQPCQSTQQTVGGA
jgi:hypothetical protein